MSEDNVNRQSDPSSSGKGANPPDEAISPTGQPPYSPQHSQQFQPFPGHPFGPQYAPPFSPQHSQQFPPSPGHPFPPQYGHHQQQPGAAFDDSSAVSETGRDLVQEAHLRAIGFWFILGGLAAVLAAFLALFDRSGVRNSARIISFLPGMILAVCPLVLGIKLGKCSNRARIIAAALCWIWSATLVVKGFLFALIYPTHEASTRARVGFAMLGLFYLAALAWMIHVAVTLSSLRSARICTAAYRELVRASPQTVKTYRSPFFWVPLAAFFGFFLLGAAGILFK